MQSIITLIKGDRAESDTDYGDSLPENMYAIARKILGADGYMLQIEGLTQYGSSVGVDRGGLWNERFGRHLRVSGGSLVEIAADGTSTTLGTITGADYASLPYSFNTQGVVADGRFWLWSPTGGFNEVTDPDLGDHIDCVWVDGYYFFTDGEYIYHSDANDESAIDPLKFATAEFMPDITVGVAKTQDNKVIVFGRYTTEYFVNIASDNFAFSRVPTRAVKVGIVGTHAKAELNDKWYILGGHKEDSPSVFVLGVGEAQKVATRAIDKILAEYVESELATAIVEARSEKANSYILIHLPNHVLCYSETIAQKLGLEFAWSILKTGTSGDPWRAQSGLYEPRLGKWVYGDKVDGRIGYLDSTAATQYGEIAEWLLYTPLMRLEAQSINELAIESIPGHTGYDDATCFISMTYDGVTFGTEWSEMYGLPNDYSKRFIIRRLGYVRDIFGMKLRGASRSRMAFGRAVLDHGY